MEASMTPAFIEDANGDHVGELMELKQNEVIIGRAPNCDIVTQPVFSSVSQRHCLLKKIREGWSITDVGTKGVGSSFGTFINGFRLEPNTPTILQPGDEIRLGTKLGKYFRFIGEGTKPISEPAQVIRRLTVDSEKRLLQIDNRILSIHFTSQEFDLLLMLWDKSGSICTFSEICANIWPDEKILSPNSIDADLRVRINTLAHILRRKLTPALDGIDIIESHHGIGYRLRF